MLTIETKELKISDELKRKVEMICRFANVKYTFKNGHIKNIKETNIAYVKPHVLKIKNNDYLSLKNVMIFSLMVIIKKLNSKI